MSIIDEIIQRRSDGALTVQQVIDALDAIEDKTLPVWADGCDCANPVVEVTAQGGMAQIGVRL